MAQGVCSSTTASRQIRGPNGSTAPWAMLITQNPLGTITSCVRTFANLRDGRPTLSGVEAMRSQVIFRENLP